MQEAAHGCEMLREQNNELASQLSQLEQQNSRLVGLVEEARGDLDAARRGAAEWETQCAGAQRRAEVLDAQLAHAAEARRRLEREAEDAAQRAEELIECRRGLSDALSRNAAQESAQQELSARLVDTEAELRRVRGDAAAVADELSAAQREVGRGEEERAGLRRAGDDRAQELRELKSAAAELRHVNEQYAKETELQARAHERVVAGLRDEVTTAKAAHDAALHQLRDDAAAARAELRATRDAAGGAAARAAAAVRERDERRRHAEHDARQLGEQHRRRMDQAAADAEAAARAAAERHHADEARLRSLLVTVLGRLHDLVARHRDTAPGRAPLEPGQLAALDGAARWRDGGAVWDAAAAQESFAQLFTALTRVLDHRAWEKVYAAER